VCGDFNLIYRAADKNNTRLNQSLMLSFLKALNTMELTELHLQGWQFTWSNEQHRPTLSSCASDHAPLILHTDIAASGKPRFLFESIWPRFLGYMEAVVNGWRGADGNKSLYLVFMGVIFSQHLRLLLEQLGYHLRLLLEQLGQQHIGCFFRTAGQQHLDCF
jgi:hypothetical protein